MGVGVGCNLYQDIPTSISLYPTNPSQHKFVSHTCCLPASVCIQQIPTSISLYPTNPNQRKFVSNTCCLPASVCIQHIPTSIKFLPTPTLLNTPIPNRHTPSSLPPPPPKLPDPCPHTHAHKHTSPTCSPTHWCPNLSHRSQSTDRSVRRSWHPTPPPCRKWDSPAPYTPARTACHLWWVTRNYHGSSVNLKCWEAWDTTCRHKAKDVTQLIAWRREVWKEEARDNLPWKDERGASFISQTLELFQR